jgi:hypothetical protein
MGPPRLVYCGAHRRLHRHPHQKFTLLINLCGCGGRGWPTRPSGKSETLSAKAAVAAAALLENGIVSSEERLTTVACVGTVHGVPGYIHQSSSGSRTGNHASADGNESSADGGWKCASCTLESSAGFLYCSTCGAAKPEGAAVRTLAGGGTRGAEMLRRLVPSVEASPLTRREPTSSGTAPRAHVPHTRRASADDLCAMQEALSLLQEAACSRCDPRPPFDLHCFGF